MSEVAKLTIALGTLGGLHDQAAATEAPLLWLVDAGAVPEADALERLLEAGTTPAASLPVDAAGDPIEAMVGGVVNDDEAMISAVRERRLPLRHSHLASLLVERADVLAIAPPDPDRYGGYAAAEWTARLMGARPGVLVTASRVRVGAVPRPDLGAALRMARSGAWQRAETLRELRRALAA